MERSGVNISFIWCKRRLKVENFHLLVRHLLRSIRLIHHERQQCRLSLSSHALLDHYSALICQLDYSLQELTEILVYYGCIARNCPSGRIKSESNYTEEAENQLANSPSKFTPQDIQQWLILQPTTT